MSKWAIITGASRGLGFSIAEIFAANGYDLLLTSRTKKNLEQAINKLKKSYPDRRIEGNAFDLGVKREAIAFGNWCLSITSQIDILVNNAGSFAGANVHDEEDGALEEMIQTNLFSAYHLSRTILPAMIRRSSGHIINMSSIAGLKAYPGGGSYSISKYALNGLNVNLREELKTHGIKVTAVYPGAVYTDSWKNSGLPQKRFIQPEDVARMIFNCTQLSDSACVEEIVIRPQLGDI